MANIGLCLSLRERIQRFLAIGHEKSALFWADKLLCLAGEQQSSTDLILYIRCLLDSRQYERAYSLLNAKGLCLRSRVFKYLGAKCLLLSKRFEDAERLLESPLSTPSLDETDPYLQKLAADWRVDSALLLLLGQVSEQLDNRTQAIEAYQRALRSDVHCVEALDALTTPCLLTVQQERDLLASLPFSEQCASVEEAALLRFLYACKLNHYTDAQNVVDVPAELRTGVTPTVADRLQTNTSVKIAAAEKLYNSNEFAAALAITSSILDAEQYHRECLPLHVCLLVAMKRVNELFVLAHNLADRFADDPIAWFAVGCYYHVCGNAELAKRYLSKCTLLDANYGAAWLMYGHAFASEQEHDQAMNCYLKATKIMKGCHLPFLYIGLEYCLTNNIKLGEKFLIEARQMAPTDPYVLHELGVVAFKAENFEMAKEYFARALSALASIRVLSDAWEPLLNNMAHSCRKLKLYDEALEYHKKALVLVPRSASTHGNMGYVYLLCRDFPNAIECLSQSLSLNADNKNVSALLDRAVDLSMTYPSSGRPSLIEMPDVPRLEPVTVLRSVQKNRIGHRDSSSKSDSSFQPSMAADDSAMVIEEVEMEMEDAGNSSTAS